MLRSAPATVKEPEGHNVRNLLTLTTVIELVVDLALAVMPSTAVRFLFGTPLETFTALTVGRWAGAGLVAAMLLYNAAAVTVLGYASIGLGLSGIGLWPAVVLHAAMAFWCVACLRSRRVNAGKYR